VEKLSKSPLIYVLAQVRIGAVLKMADHVPQIQERLRKTGYPLYRASEIQEVRFGLGQPELKTTPRWYFDAGDRSTGFLLQADSVVFHTSVYDTSEVFFAALSQGLGIVHEVVGVEVAERLGLRYVDAFQADPGHRLAEYFRTGISGITLDEIGATQPRLLINLVADTQVGGKLVIRLGQNTGPGFLPPDLHPLELTLTKPFAPNEEIAVLDYDHFIERVVPFSVQEIVDTFDALHQVTSGAFRKTVSEFALQSWR
jgi:uncharacterized protein (TIGR04255 family)